MSNEVINVSSYRFVKLDKEGLPKLREQLKEQAVALTLKGTILLSTEGINLFVAGTNEQIESFRTFLYQWPEFNDMWFKESPSAHQPFTRMLVRIKKEIIAMGHDEIIPEQETAPYVQPEELKHWYEQGKDMLVLDTRNDYEISLGTFDDAYDPNITTFRDFPAAVEQLPEEYKNKTVVTYCTGGIRCEKAAQLMRNKGFKDVYQLEGGILNYFEKVGGEHYQGECFVFDKRVAVDADLKETDTKMCFSCRQPLPMDLQSDNEICPHCNKNRNGKRYYAHLPKLQHKINNFAF